MEFSVKRWDHYDARSREGLIESANPCHAAKVLGLYLVSNTVCLTVLAAKGGDYITAAQHLCRL